MWTGDDPILHVSKDTGHVYGYLVDFIGEEHGYSFAELLFDFLYTADTQGHTIVSVSPLGFTKVSEYSAYYSALMMY